VVSVGIFVCGVGCRSTSYDTRRCAADNYFRAGPELTTIWLNLGIWTTFSLASGLSLHILCTLGVVYVYFLPQLLRVVIV